MSIDTKRCEYHLYLKQTKKKTELSHVYDLRTSIDSTWYFQRISWWFEHFTYQTRKLPVFYLWSIQISYTSANHTDNYFSSPFDTANTMFHCWTKESMTRLLLHGKNTVLLVHTNICCIFNDREQSIRIEIQFFAI